MAKEVDTEMDNKQGKVNNQKTSQYGINVPSQVLRTLVIALAVATRMTDLAMPDSVVFDEVHFGRFAGYYMNSTFFFDVNPPFPKLVFAFSGYMTGFDGRFDFKTIGQDMTSIMPHVWYLRFFPSLFSVSVVPCIFEILILLGCSAWVAVFGSLLAVYDNMLVIQGRFILLDSFLHFFTVFSIMAFLKFRKQSNRPFSFYWCFWLFLTGVGLVGAISTKYSAFSLLLLIGGLMAYDMWNMIEDLNISPTLWLIHCACRLQALVVVPVLLYLLQFYIVFTVLTKTGPQDVLMSSAFQASLRGGLAKVTKGQSPVVAYGSQVTIRHTHGKQCWLHSHPHEYPVKYPDKRGSSAQQQVTCYPFKDVNNWWIVKDPNADSLSATYPPVPVKNGDIIQLIHGTTGRALNSHDVAAPLTPQHQEVSCYIDYNISMAAQNLWRLEIINPESSGQWRTLQSQIRLVHVNTSQAIKITGKQLPEWGFRQFEVCTDTAISNDATVWNVEEHQQNITYPEGKEPEKPEEPEPEDDDSRVVPMPFFDKFKELQYKMLTSDKDLKNEHSYSSRPQQWPFMRKGVAYWVDSQSNKQIFCLGNPLVWWPATVGVASYLFLLGVYLLRRRRAEYDMSEKSWERYVFCGYLLVIGYFVHYLPFFPTERTLFIQQYLPALLFKIILLAFIVQHMLHAFRNMPLVGQAFSLVLVIYCFLVFWSFRYFSPMTYGDQSLTRAEINRRKWLNTWNFLIQ